MRWSKTVRLMLMLGALLAEQPAVAQTALGAQGPEGEPNRWPAMAGALARSRGQRSRHPVPPAGRRAVPPRDHRTRDLGKRAASRPNAAAGVSRLGGVAGVARVCGA